ncbi:MAG TPA: hypothetical protein VF137_00500 [Candidatus Dormibacteraeota bacterium]
MTEDLERWLADELGRGLGGLQPAPQSLDSITSRQAGRGRRVTVKAAALAAAAVLVSTGVVFAAGTALTGTPNPAAWGQQVSEHVETCKQQLPAGQHGIGSCVSSFARQHGESQRAQHSQSGSQSPGHGPSHKLGPGSITPSPRSTKGPQPKTPAR